MASTFFNMMFSYSSCAFLFLQFLYLLCGDWCYMFVSCSTLGSFTMSHNITTIGEHCFNYCTALETIIYEGSLADWAASTKRTNWDGKGGSGIAISGFTRIQCLDGFM